MNILAVGMYLPIRVSVVWTFPSTELALTRISGLNRGRALLIMPLFTQKTAEESMDTEQFHWWLQRSVLTDQYAAQWCGVSVTHDNLYHHKTDMPLPTAFSEWSTTLRSGSAANLPVFSAYRESDTWPEVVDVVVLNARGRRCWRWKEVFGARAMVREKRIVIEMEFRRAVGILSAATYF